jgi:heterodisulfide reductase subunit C
MKWVLDQKSMDEHFVEKIEAMSGQKITSCYQCGKCSAGCPVCKDMDIAPNQVIRLLQLGIKKEVAESQTIWLCASCQTCSIRCPQMIDLAKVMDALRIYLQREALSAPNDWWESAKKTLKRIKESLIYIFQMDIHSNLTSFNYIFLESIRYYGRVFEPGLIYNYNINSGYLFSNFLKAPLMLIKSKIKFIPSEVKRIEKVQKIFERVEMIEKGERGEE